MTEQSVQEFEQQHLDHVIDEIKQAKEKAEEKIHTARHDIKGINKQIDDMALIGSNHAWQDLTCHHHQALDIGVEHGQHVPLLIVLISC